MEKRRLYKSRGRRMLAGVCGGLAEYFDLDVTWVRLGVVALCLVYGSGFLVYLLAALILPEAPADSADSYAPPAWQGSAQAGAPDGTASAYTAPDNTAAPGNAAPAADSAPAMDDAPAADIHSLDIRLGGVGVVLTPSAEWSLQTQNVQGCQSVVRDGVWHISRDGAPFTLPGGRVTVTFPQGQPLQWLGLNIGAGGISGGGLTCRNADLEAGAGSIELNGLTVSERCNLKVGMGSVVLRGHLAAGARIDCGMGSVKCRLQRPQEYGYTVDCGVGSVVIDGRAHAGLAADAAVNMAASVQYRVNCGMGSVEIGFVD